MEADTVYEDSITSDKIGECLKSECQGCLQRIHTNGSIKLYWEEFALEIGLFLFRVIWESEIYRNRKKKTATIFLKFAETIIESNSLKIPISSNENWQDAGS